MASVISFTLRVSLSIENRIFSGEPLRDVRARRMLLMLPDIFMSLPPLVSVKLLSDTLSVVNVRSRSLMRLRSGKYGVTIRPFFAVR